MSLGPVMLDIEGPALTPADRELLRAPAVGGVILFTRNYESPEQIADLVSQIRSLRSPPLIVAVDHEGGRVQRFRNGFSAIPAMRRLGHEYDSGRERSLKLARMIAWLMASELRAAGIDLCFAPCVDLDWGISEIIGDRAFHSDPEAVGELATEFARGLRDAGMAAVLKHFPGHGAVTADSHEQLPVDRREYADILDDVRPYEKLVNNGLAAGIMLAHVVYREIDALPAGFSSVWVERELRGRLGFGGAVFCDDLSMKATVSYGRMRRRAAMALEAGCDMILVCNDRLAAESAVEALADYSNPLSLVRLARMHGTRRISRVSLLASQQWRDASAELARWAEPPELELDA